MASYRRALEIKPDYAEAHSNLGNALQDLGQLDDAVASYRRALEIKPDYAEAHSNLGNALQDLGQLDDAVASYRRALEIKPDFAEAHSNLIFTLDLSAGADIATLQQERSRWDAMHAAPLAALQRPHANRPDPERRLRIGYVSADFRMHSAAERIRVDAGEVRPGWVRGVRLFQQHDGGWAYARIRARGERLEEDSRAD